MRAFLGWVVVGAVVVGIRVWPLGSLAVAAAVAGCVALWVAAGRWWARRHPDESMAGLALGVLVQMRTDPNMWVIPTIEEELRGQVQQCGTARVLAVLAAIDQRWPVADVEGDVADRP